MSRLSPQQVAHFRDEGYLIVDDIFTPADLEPLRQEFHARINFRAQELQAEGQLSVLHAEAGFDRQLVRIYEDNPEVARGIIHWLEGQGGGGHRGVEMFKTITHPKLVAAIESLVGPEIVGSSVYRVRPKLPGFARGEVPWHQDSGYFAPHCDDQLVVTCWIPLVDANEANGCMRILPRAHCQGICRHYTEGHAGFLVIEDQDLPMSPDRSVPAPVPRGGAVFMWNTTPHCSTPNKTDHIRWSIDLRYQSSTVPNNVDLVPDMSQTTQDPGFEIACYAPEADFVIQSSRPEGVTSFEQFVERRALYEQAQREGKLTWPQRGWTKAAVAV